MLTASGLTVAHGSRTLFRDVSLALSPGRRVALVGANGQGKTTLLEILVGDREPDRGSITKPRDLRVGYLPQEIPSEDDGTVLDTVLGGRPDVMRLHHLLAAGPTGTGPEELDAYGEAQTRFEQLGGYALEAEAHAVLAGLGFAPADADRQVSELSGGWRMRVALARLLLSGPDLLVLDEPTASLDPDVADRVRTGLLELNAADGTALLVTSHNMVEVERLCERVVFVNGGRIVADGTPAEIAAQFGRGDLEEVFLHLARGETS